jgi:hypothetical protein
MANESAMYAVERIESLILTIRGQRVMLDSDLAKIYGVTTKQLNQQFRRNLERFPSDFAFELTNQELTQMRSQIVTSSRRNLLRLPVVFTEHGALMLASILNSPIAVEASVRVVRAFILMREQLAAHKELAGKLAHPRTAPVFSLASPTGGEGRGEEAQGFTAQIPSPRPSPRSGGERETGAVSRCATGKLADLEQRVGGHDAAIQDLFEAIRQLVEPPLPENRREIGFHVRETAPPYRIKTRPRM